jgi:hypothetical protein
MDDMLKGKLEGEMEITAPPAPWHLTGNGYVLVYRFPRDFAVANSPYGKTGGGFGAVMLVDYQTTPVGAYHELLFIPGVVEYPGANGYSISKIYVSSMPSVVGGQLNWGLPKELGEFEWQSQPDGGDRVTISQGGQPFAEFMLKPFGVRFPLTGALMPSLTQHRDGKTFITKLKSRALGQLAQLKDSRIHTDAFPNISAYRPIIAFRVIDFRMTFPVPEVIT